MTALVAVTSENWKEYLNQILEIENLSFPTPWSDRAFLEEIRNPVSRLLVLRLGKRLLGYICFWIFQKEIHLLNLAVHPEGRAKGFGQLLLSEMIDTGVSNGMNCARLEVRPSNVVAQNLYKRLGFEEAGRRPGYYNDTREDAVIMTLPLVR